MFQCYKAALHLGFVTGRIGAWGERLCGTSEISSPHGRSRGPEELGGIKPSKSAVYTSAFSTTFTPLQVDATCPLLKKKKKRELMKKKFFLKIEQRKGMKQLA